MKHQSLIIAAMACITILFASANGSQGHVNDESQQVGRYQIATFGYGYENEGRDKTEDGVWVIDTATSQTWYYSNSHWRSAGSPD